MKKAETWLSDAFAMATITDLQCFMDKYNNSNTEKPAVVWDVGLGQYLG